MIELVKGDLMMANVDALVNTVNCVGVMGKGVALQFKKAYPDNFKAYEKACRQRLVVPGRMFVWPTGQILGTKFIINFPTKNHWKEKSKIEYLQEGLDDLVSIVRKFNIKSIAMPPLGCGNGGLEWRVIRPLIEEKLISLKDVNILLYEPKGSPENEQINIRTKIPTMTIFNATMLRLINRYLWQEDTLSRLEIQKLAYFQKEAGDPNFSSLAFEGKKYGPYAAKLGNLIHDMDGHFLHNCGDKNDPWRQISIDKSAVKRATEILDKKCVPLQYLTRVFNVIDGFEEPFGMELLSTVHWVAHYCQYKATDVDSAVTEVYDWNERKKNLFKPEHIKIAWYRLVEQGWITL